MMITDEQHKENKAKVVEFFGMPEEKCDELMEATKEYFQKNDPDNIFDVVEWVKKQDATEEAKLYTAYKFGQIYQAI